MICPDRVRGVAIIKYKKNGKIGLNLSIDESDLEGEDNKFLKEIENRNIKYFIWGLTKKFYILDMGLDFKIIRSMLKFIWEEIFEEKLLFDLHFERPGKLIDFKDAKELGKKGINIDIPITDWERFIYKLKGKKARP